MMPHLWLLLLIISSPSALGRSLHKQTSCTAPILPVKSAYFYYGQAQAAADVDASPFTHIFYAFAPMDQTTYNVMPAPNDPGTINTFSATVRRSNPKVKTLLSIGGGGSDATAFSNMAATLTTRAAFINQSIAAARLYSFDGLDLDWEFPQSDVDMANLGKLFAEWRAAVQEENPKSPLLLTAAVKYNVTVAYGGAGTYPVKSIAHNLDWVNIMSYDLHGGWETETGQHTALYDATELQTLTVNFGVKHWLEAGLPSYRGALGLAAYGRAWYLADAAQHGVGAPASGAGPVPTFTEIQQSVAAYNGSCDHDGVTRSAFCIWTSPPQTVWVGFDDPVTISAKVRYLKSQQLRGYAFWSIGGDVNGLLFKQASKTL
ncbi:hypothetical protein L7F22_026717 [Adiantum nelumboides]|nr:hypothetical protein [Adiantum nelumboides]